MCESCGCVFETVNKHSKKPSLKQLLQKFGIEDKHPVTGKIFCDGCFYPNTENPRYIELFTNTGDSCHYNQRSEQVIQTVTRYELD